MIDIRLIRENPEIVKKNCRNRGYDAKIVEEIISADKQWRKLKYKEDEVRAERNKVSKQINEAKKERNEKKVKELMARAKSIPEELKKIDENETSLKEKINLLLSLIPNIQARDVPIGGEKQCREIHKFGKIPKFKFPVKNHVELLENLGLLDLKASAKLSGSGFYLFRGELAEFERALINFMLDINTQAGFLEINPPQIANEKILFGTGNLPKFEKDLYKTREGLYLIPTAEVVLANLYADEILKESELPKKFTAFTQCYRTEAGRHGLETPGIFRLHQFEKVEMVYLCRQEDSWKFLEEMTNQAEKILKLLKLPYRRIVLATQDAGFASAKTYDLEAWSPSLKKYLEVSSCSNCTDFQARRMNTRYQSKEGIKFVHTLNGSGLATPRLLISLVENNQQKDGSILIPKILQKYMHGKKKIEIKKTKKIK
jgi:seryl-tRNA synthetase